MRLRDSLCVISILLVAACGQAENQERPLGILPPDSMVSVMCRVHLTEASILQRQLLSDSASKASALQSYRKAFEQSGISYDDFSRSFEYYRNRPEEFQKIYDQVLIRLGDEQATLSGR